MNGAAFALEQMRKLYTEFKEKFPPPYLDLSIQGQTYTLIIDTIESLEMLVEANEQYNSKLKAV